MDFLEPENQSRVSAHLLDEDGEPLVFEGFGKLDVLSSLVVDGEGSDNHVGQTSQQLPHHPVPLLLITVVHLQEEEQSGGHSRVNSVT